MRGKEWKEELAGNMIPWSPAGSFILAFPDLRGHAHVFCLLAEMSGTLSLIDRSSVVFRLCEWHIGTMKTLLSCDPTLLTCAPSSAGPGQATTPHPRADLPDPRSQCLIQDPQPHVRPAVPPGISHQGCHADFLL